MPPWCTRAFLIRLAIYPLLLTYLLPPASLRRAGYNDVDQGWIFIIKPTSFRLLKRGENHNFEIAVNPASNSNRVSIPSSEDAARDSCFGPPIPSAKQRYDCLKQNSDRVVFECSWLADRIRQCGEQVGATVNSCEEGWDSN